jgi:hypothetical protein
VTCLTCARAGAEERKGTISLSGSEVTTQLPSTPPPAELPVLVGEPGASALREYQRRRTRREEEARRKLGRLGVALAALTSEPQETKAWKQGGEAEVKTAARLAKHLDGRGVKMLHDRLVPGHGRANIDHILVGAGGITVVDTKAWRGRVRVERSGGLFSSRLVLLVDGRDRTALVEGVEAQAGYARGMLKMTDFEGLDVRGALCFVDPSGLPFFASLRLREVLIASTSRVAKLARRPGELDAEGVERVWRHLDRCFPHA